MRYLFVGAVCRTTTAPAFVRNTRLRALRIKPKHLQLHGTLEHDLCSAGSAFVESFSIGYRMKDWEVKTKARDGDESFPVILSYFDLYLEIQRSLERQTNEISRRGVPRRITSKTQSRRTSGSVPDHIPIRGYTSRREIQERALNHLSDGTLIATVYGVEWAFTIMWRGRKGV